MSKFFELIVAGIIAIALTGPAVARDGNDLQPTLEQDIAYVQTEWARIRYHVPDDTAKLQDYQKLGDYAARVSTAYPYRAEPKIWEAIVVSSAAGVNKGLSSLGKVAHARELLEAALRIDETALEGSAHTSLGSLYYQVPGWPLSFGSNRRAEKHLKAALAINPDGIDPNYFYGDYLVQIEKYNEAAAAFEHALEAAPRPGRELADAGRRQEIKAALSKIRSKLSTSSARLSTK